ncbi:uncharacterized protein PADG_05039 [Paracoccidioides brasiliensis Pb18]|uniref:Enoyl-CoA hydratase n=1 Tax=Paracoccidioides brasiliensis (strain Pb18) TaxID=502780 RepID=C1GBN8_PARBD|nr:uncharacterized protein PADG_05039 [Paracoccidioides brasiliensis Pb18]EEH48960.2 hypothetical protein PADG_05039 [Paracoccidioides brasiliensis Pb18]
MKLTRFLPQAATERPFWLGSQAVRGYSSAKNDSRILPYSRRNLWSLNLQVPGISRHIPASQSHMSKSFTIMTSHKNKNLLNASNGNSNSNSLGNGAITTSITTHSSNAQVATVTVSRAAKLNAMNSHLLTALPAALQTLTATHPNLLAIILTGEGSKSFVGGADIAEMASITNPAEAREFINRVHDACKSIRDCPVPVIGRINGLALGAGLEIAAACDIRVASSHALLGMPEVRMGVPSVVEAALLPGLIGWGRTRLLLLLGDNIGAREALEWGLVEKVVEPEELDAAVAKWVESLAKNGLESMRNQKELIRRWEQLGLNDAIEAGVDHFGRAFEADGKSVSGVDRSETEPGRMMGEFLSRKKGKGSKL